MSRGNQQLRTTWSTLKNVVSSSQPSSSVLPSGTYGTPPAIITFSSQEGRVCVLKKVEQVMENFRGGQSTRFQTLTNIIDELDKWTEASDDDTEQALNSYMAKLNSISANLDGNGLGNSTQPSRLSNFIPMGIKSQGDRMSYLPISINSTTLEELYSTPMELNIREEKSLTRKRGTQNQWKER